LVKERGLMSTFEVPQRELETRLTKFQQTMVADGIDGAFLVQGADIAYFSGDELWQWIYVPAHGDPILCAPKDDNIPKVVLGQVVGFVGEHEILNAVTEHCRALPKVLGLEMDILPFNLFNHYRAIFQEPECVDVSVKILSLRAIKSEWEIAQMERTAKRTSEAFEYLSDVISPELSEMEFAAMAEGFVQEKSSMPISLRIRDYKSEGYPWHVLSGHNSGKIGVLDSPASGEGTSAAFPCGAGPKKLEKHEPIMVDFAYEYNGYHMDETRMFSIGPMSDEALWASEAAIKIHDTIIEKARPGLKASELYDISVSLADELGYGHVYLGPPGHKVSFVGHGIGLELIERPFLARGKEDVLQLGMTFAVEPKMVFKDRFGVGVESVFVVTDDGGRLISKVPVKIFTC